MQLSAHLVLLAVTALAVAGIGPAAGADAPAAPAPRIDKLSNQQLTAFRNAAVALDAKEDAKRARTLAVVEAWGPLGKKAAQQLCALMRTKWSFSGAQDGWIGKPTRSGGMRTIEVPGLGTRSYHVAVPAGYTPNQNWPMMLSLHGAGGEGAGEFTWMWEKWAPKWPGFIVSPSGIPAGAQWFPEQRPFLLMVVREMRRIFAIDDAHLILHGFSNGGNGAWYYGTHCPDLWSVMVARSGGDPETFLLSNFMHLPAFVVHGDADTVIPPTFDIEATDSLKKLGYEVVFKKMPGSHKPFQDEVNDEILQWAGTHAKDPYPKQLSFKTSTAADQACAWIDLGDHAEKAQVEVSAEVAGQSIAVKVQGCKRLTLWLADALVDLDQDVTVTWNGASVHAGPVPRRAMDMLGYWHATADRLRLPAARLELAAP